MLREIAARQVQGDPPRRWFESSKCDLIVWLSEDKTPRGFQFCYDKDDWEHALTWFEGLGFSHMRIDTAGGVFAHGRGTPLLVADGTLDAARISEVFQAESKLVPPEYGELVSMKLQELAKKNGLTTDTQKPNQ